MMRIPVIGIVALGMVLLLCPLGERVLAADGSPSPIEIKARTMTAESKRNLVTFEGSVVATRGDATMTADRMVVRYGDDKRVQQIDAAGKVRLLRQGRQISSDKAVYTAREDKVVFTGSPVFAEEASTVTGSKIIYFIANDRAVVEDSKVILHEQERH